MPPSTGLSGIQFSILNVLESLIPNDQKKYNNTLLTLYFVYFPGVCRPLTYASNIRCEAYLEHWTYNAETGVCEMFVYGGCGASANNFYSEEACNRKCGVVTPVTKAPEPTSAGGTFSFFIYLLLLLICTFFLLYYAYRISDIYWVV